MSRGMGKIQQKIMQILPEHDGSHYDGWMCTKYLAHLVYQGTEPDQFLFFTRSQLMSLQRAIRGLKAKGMVKTHIACWTHEGGRWHGQVKRCI